MMIAEANRRADPYGGWTDAVEIGLENGRSPLFHLGAGLSLLENLPTLVALHAFAHERSDVTAPTAVIGGQPLLWLAALMQEREAQSASTPPITVVFAGPDLATEIAGVELLAQPTRDTIVPPGFAPLLAPSEQAGAPLWESLPLLLAQESSAPPPADGAAEVADRWLAWAGAGLAFVLIVLALLV